MVDIKKILVPVDFSECSDHALDVAIAIARKLGASIELLHAYELPVLASPEGAIFAGPETMRGLMDQAAEQLGKRIEARSRFEVPLTSIAMQGPAWSAIVERARSLPADLIVMGTHGRTGFVRMVLGSVAERVVRSAEVPVLTVHPPNHVERGSTRA
jgi:nucleotide-binding universal stress UspA family protein